jgi:hypothetical protein
MQAGLLDNGQGQPRFATVSSVDPNTATARVMLEPDGVLTGWLPLLSSWTGAGWGMVCPPKPGDQVLVVPQEGDAAHGVIVGRSFSDVQHPPAAPPGEFWLVHESGSSLRLCNDGTIRLNGDLHVEGDVYDRHGPLSRLRTTYNQHVHGVAGGATTQPTPQD